MRLASNATISCRQQTGGLSVTWNFIPLDSSRIIILLRDKHYNFLQQGNEQTLLIVNVTAAHAGKYYCEKLSALGSCITDKSALTIFSKLPSIYVIV